ncbi:excinuclease ABC subunit A [Methanobrevibacter sp. 87.7]|uniref:ATP-binding cassette domain-containing protein n=1 Tax=Methanobrevibacter sp. 87.7 TaxID=387957 RepID=UPI000B504F64|nr:ATP-binding cassette domain-containing protein [Methanobrevibacter sp. 87.7]OWT33322.1 excinuclease ABC subunit A [Methanobrevibacter sp. 87.7]
MFNNMIIIKGAYVHNLKNIDVNIPLGKIVGIAGVSGSGKSSLALGILYAEGSRRYLDAFSTYTRRRISNQSEKAKVESIEYVPAALALRQRPNIPNIRSTFGTSTELLNYIRLLFSRCGSYYCPNGHLVPPSLNVSRELPIVCPVCGEEFYGLSAEEYSFNSDGACPRCSGTGTVREVDDSKLVPDQTKTLEEGAVRAWNLFGISWMYRAAGELGVPVDVPFKDLSDEEKEIVYHGKEVDLNVVIPFKNGKMFDLNVKYRNAHQSIVEALNGTKTEKGLNKINQFLTVMTCPECHGSRLNKRANSTLLNGLTLDELSHMTLGEIVDWLPSLITSLPNEMKNMAKVIIDEFMDIAKILMDLGLDYLSLDRKSSTLSTGELQRVQLAKTVRNHTTGILYVLDEPSIGLHPSNVDGLISVVRKLVEDGNSVILVDHDIRILSIVDYLIEIGPGAGNDGGNIIFKGSLDEISNSENSLIGPFLNKDETIIVREKATKENMFDEGTIHLKTSNIHTVKPLDVDIPKNRFTAISGPSGSGKTTLILESLFPSIKALINNEDLPEHVLDIEDNCIKRINLIDAKPIGVNVRSTIATYSGVLDDLRKLFGKLSDEYKTRDFSYNTGKLRCLTCKGTGCINMDVQFLPDMEITCLDCNGLRYSNEIDKILYNGLSIKDYMVLTVDEALTTLNTDSKLERKIYRKLNTLSELGLGYLTLGEATPTLSGGEAQRLKLASDLGKSQKDTIFIFDEPTIGLHPLDVRVLLKVLQKLLDKKATIIVIEHDLDLLANADYIIDMGPSGGINGGEIVAKGTLDDIINNKNSKTAIYLKDIK